MSAHDEPQWQQRTLLQVAAAAGRCCRSRLDSKDLAATAPQRRQGRYGRFRFCFNECQQVGAGRLGKGSGLVGFDGNNTNRLEEL